MPRQRCSQCLRPQNYCLCNLIPRLQSITRVLILQHPDETRHALNTARLAALGLVNSELLIGENFDGLEQYWRDYSPWLLFPGEQALELEAAAQRPESLPRLLIVPDGTWRKARKLLHCNPILAALPRLSLPQGLTSRYRLRKAPEAGALATLEAIVHTLNGLEAPNRFDTLLLPFEALIDGQIEAMGQATFRRNHEIQP
ncbi:hypothetical protein IQ22_02384 [Pseudomonas duriflava]|uniref:tRNA-uridine aminocarboxypropyltransferase n=1 Tax=Pseudomonas duriflava TaxID=459528 RepID=A0A562QAJ3_9PSED|nr:DTW domain-containing protein [Pseudomonas duriflava]TWI53777.1 hypothetical protein IQ22_02384 [Pseudomonas duriflava]